MVLGGVLSFSAHQGAGIDAGPSRAETRDGNPEAASGAIEGLTAQDVETRLLKRCPNQKSNNRVGRPARYDKTKLGCETGH